MKDYLIQINISNGGVPKVPVLQALVDENGIIGDRQHDLRYHGGPERAICIFDLGVIKELQQEGHPIQCGSTGENFTICYQNYGDLKLGSKLAIGQHVILEITGYASPCKTIQASFTDFMFKRISQKLFPKQSRLYAKVLKGGWVFVNDEIKLIPIIH